MKHFGRNILKFKTMFIFCPLGGLANRMRVIDSAYNFSKTSNKDIRLYWMKDQALNCKFETIWEPIEKLRDTNSRFFIRFFKLRRKSVVFRKLLSLLDKWKWLKVYDEMQYDALVTFTRNIEEVTRYKHAIIFSFTSFYAQPIFLRHLFNLQPDILTKIENETKGFTENTIGVHIRRTDNIDSIQQSPLELFIEKMKEEVKLNPETNFYVASDNAEVKATLKAEFGDQVMLAKGELARDSESGIIQAVVEMYALSGTSKILGSFFSSFSEMAAIIGGKRIEVIKK
jgi:hypothetical protein